MYFPILLSKAGELTALSRLTPIVKSGISPVIEILPNSLPRVEAQVLSQWVFDDNQVLFDLSLFLPFNRTAVRAFFTNLFDAGVNAVPVIQQNSDARYIGLVQQLVATHGCKVCIRTSNGSGGFVNYNTTVTNLMDQVGTTRANTLLLIDLGYVDQNNYAILGSFAVNLIQRISNRNQYSNIIVASSSFPENLSQLIPAGRLYRLTRFEWEIWLIIQGVGDISDLVEYGDYGTKYPFFSDVSFPGSCSIKYTIEREFVIYRGEVSGNHPDGNGQYITFAGRLIHTADYSGVGFSWGDDEINRIAHEVMTNPRKRPGNATTWVEISQNHHITLLHSLL